MVNRIEVNLLVAGNMPAIEGVIIHNDAGSKNATPEWYANTFLPPREKTLGIAHYYIDRSTIARVVDTYRIAYHAGDGSGRGNMRHIGYEVCQSIGASKEDFLANEDMTLRQVAEDMAYYKLAVNRDTVRLHREFTSTTCPHRSLELHGGTVNNVKDYFIGRIKYYQSLGTTVDEMIANEQQNARPAPKPTVPVTGQAHIQGFGWVSGKNGLFGTTGQSLRLEALALNANGKPLSGAVHIQNVGDVEATGLFGSVGLAHRIEAIKLNVPKNVQYRVHMQDTGWTSWVGSGEWCGSKGKSKRIEAVEFKTI